MEPQLRIGALAAAAGVGVQTLRYYERRGLLFAHRRSSSGYREYTADAVRRITFIRRAQSLGFTLDEIKDLLALRVRPGRRCEPVKKSAVAARERVQERLTVLQHIDASLGRLLHACETRQATDECPILAALEPNGRMS